MGCNILKRVTYPFQECLHSSVDEVHDFHQLQQVSNVKEEENSSNDRTLRHSK